MDVQDEVYVPIVGLPAGPGPARWWPLALSERVGGSRPLGVVCDGTPIVLYRDVAGQVRALEDRCGHRRAPLSLGRVTADGRLQCGYHGWTYDGLSGTCTAIPHLSASERVPSHYAVRAYDAIERNGFVFVSERGPNEEAPAQGPLSQLEDGRAFYGCTSVSLPYEHYVAALADGPHLLMRFAGLAVTNYVSADPAECDEGVAMERGVVWAARRLNHRFVTEYPWTLRLTGRADGATTTVELFTRDQECALVASIAVAPAARGATSVHWRGAVLPSAGGVGAMLLRGWSRLRGAPLRMRSCIDGHALARLERLYSPAWMSCLPKLRIQE